MSATYTREDMAQAWDDGYEAAERASVAMPFNPYRIPSPDTEGGACHCGRPLAYGFDGDPTHHRGMCADCDAARCDAYPQDCPHRTPSPDTAADGSET